MSDECFYAERGGGAYLNGRQLPLRKVTKRLNQAVAGVEIKYLRSGKLSSRMNTLSPFGTIRSLGSSTLIGVIWLRAATMCMYTAARSCGITPPGR